MRDHACQGRYPGSVLILRCWTVYAENYYLINSLEDIVSLAGDLRNFAGHRGKSAPQRVGWPRCGVSAKKGGYREYPPSSQAATIAWVMTAFVARG